MNVSIHNCDSGEGYSFAEADAPTGVMNLINAAIERGQVSGVIFDGGARYEWETAASPQHVLLEFTRADVVCEVISIELSSWKAFEQLAQRREVDPKEWLTAILGSGLADGIAVREMVRWLFPRKHERAPELEYLEIQPKGSA